jgi:hypothetical protein
MYKMHKTSHSHLKDTDLHIISVTFGLDNTCLVSNGTENMKEEENQTSHWIIRKKLDTLSRWVV